MTQKAAFQYPNSIFKQTTPDETQQLSENPRFSTWYKGWLTRSKIYERKLPDGIVGALRVDGPADSFMALDNSGNIKLVTGVKDPNRGPGSGLLGIKTFGQQQYHQNRSNLQYNAGDDEEGIAINVLCYGDYVEKSVGSERHISATKILITATSDLVLEGGSVRIQSESELELSGQSITTAQINKKDIVLGQKKTTGAGENTTEQFDPRSTTVINTPGSLQSNIAQDWRVLAGGAIKMTAAGGPGALIKDRVFGMDLNTATDFSISGAKSGGIYSAGFIDVASTGEFTLTATDTQVTTANFTGDFATTSLTTADLDITSAAVNITGTADVTITGANVKLIGALIYLN